MTAFSWIPASRGARYDITVENPAHVCRGVRTLKLNGEYVSDNRIPLCPEGSVNKVEIVMG